MQIYIHLSLCTLAAAHAQRQQIAQCNVWHSHRCSQPAQGPPLPHRPVPQRETPAPCVPVPPTCTDK